MLVHFTTFNTTLEGKTLREVKCENCGQEYVYVLDVRVQGSSVHFYGIGSGAGAEKSRADATTKLEKQLEDGVEDAPCPRCGWIQDHMLAVARRRKRTDYLELLGGVGTGASGSGIFILLYDRASFAESDWQTMLVGLSGTFLMFLPILIWRIIEGRGWNPNDCPVERRLAVAAEISIKREDYLKMVQRQEGGTPAIDPSRQPRETTDNSGPGSA